MKTMTLFIVGLAASLTARADFSYTSTTKSSAGLMAGAMEGRTTKHYLKGQKLKLDHGDTAQIFDLDAGTITSIHNAQKTYTVIKFSDMAEMGQKFKEAGVEFNIDVKETGQRKNINGYNAHEVLMTTEMDSPQARQAGMKMQMELDMWISPDPPGSQEAIAFYKKNAGRFPWSALAGGGRGGQNMQQAMAELYRKVSALNGVSVLQVMRMKAAGAEAQMAQAQQQMAEARAKLEEAKKKGGQQAQLAEQALAMMGRQASGGSMFETTIESSNFSTSSIPDSVFAIPAGYQKTERK